MAAPTVPDFRPGAPAGTAPDVLNTLVRDVFNGLLDRPRFRARRTGALAVVENTHQFVAWDTADEDSHTGWAASPNPTRYTVPPGWTGWWLVSGGVSLSGTGAAQLVLIPSIAVNGGSHTGVTGGAGWEGVEAFIPTGVAAQPKWSPGVWRVYANAGDWIELDLWFSNESAIVAADVTAGLQCRIELVWDGA